MTPFDIFLGVVIVLLIAAIIGNNYFHAKYKQIVAPVAPTVDPVIAEMNAVLARIRAAATTTSPVPVVTPVAPAPLPVSTAVPIPLNPALDPSKNPAASLLVRSGWGGVANRDEGALTAALAQTADPALALAAAKEVGKMLNMSDTQAGGVAFCKTLPAASLEQVRTAFLDPAGLYAPDQAGYDANRPNQSALYEQAWNAFLR